MANAGYSGTSLAKKMGIRKGTAVATVNEPDGFRALLDPHPDDVRIAHGIDDSTDIVVLFCPNRAALDASIREAARAIFPDGAIWVAWPKKASKVSTDMTGNVVRDVVLPLGLVDVKVAAIDQVWSGLRVVWRKELRDREPG
jgi:hypothetical protein